LVLANPADWERLQSGKRGQGITWAFVLKPTIEGNTRLVARSRGEAHPRFWRRAVNCAFGEPAHFIMERKMLLTIKELVENYTAE
jgi:hypothetical protein